MEVSSIKECFGYYSVNSASEMLSQDKQYKVFNALNFIGYFPILGIFTGLLRLLAVSSEWNKKTANSVNKTFLKTQLIRALTEFLGAGSLLLIPDIIITINSNYSNNKQKISRNISSYTPI